jgi:hypothetical protein
LAARLDEVEPEQLEDAEKKIQKQAEEALGEMRKTLHC